MTCVRFDRPSLTTASAREQLLSTFERTVAAQGDVAALAELARAAPPELGLDVILAHRADEDARMLTLVFGHGVEARTQHALDQIGYGEFLCGRVARNRRMAVVADVGASTDPACAACRKLKLLACVGLPVLHADGRLAGVIAFGSRGTTRFGEADIDLFAAIAGRAAEGRDLVA